MPFRPIHRRFPVLLAVLLASASACVQATDDEPSHSAVAVGEVAVGAPWTVRQIGRGTSIAPTDDVTVATGTHTIRAGLPRYGVYRLRRPDPRLPALSGESSGVHDEHDLRWLVLHL